MKRVIRPITDKGSYNVGVVYYELTPEEEMDETLGMPGDTGTVVKLNPNDTATVFESKPFYPDTSKLKRIVSKTWYYREEQDGED